MLGGGDQDIISTRWYDIPCEGYENIRYHFQGEAGDYWFAVQIRNHRNPIYSVEVNVDGQWRQASRSDYNYWVLNQCCGSGPFSLRIEDIFGNQIVNDGIVLSAGLETPGQGQFPACTESDTDFDTVFIDRTVDDCNYEDRTESGNGSRGRFDAALRRPLRRPSVGRTTEPGPWHDGRRNSGRRSPNDSFSLF